MLKKLLFPVLAIACLSCKQAKTDQANTGFLYFDLKNYFDLEASRLSKLNPSVLKTVEINGSVESKEVKIKNWEQELNIFVHADINKTAWAGKFEVIKSDTSVLYQSKDKKIAVKSILIKSSKEKVNSIEIVSVNSNTVFNSTDTLKYFPDQFYEISKSQKIKLLQSKTYHVKAVFK